MKPYVVLDVETTGLNPAKHMLLEVTLLKVVDGKITNRYDAIRHAPQVVGDTQAILWHARNGLLEACADEETALSLDMIADGVQGFLRSNWGPDPVVVASKNGWKLDLPFLTVDLEIPFDTWHHRVLDPAPKLMTPDDDELPSLAECARRVGINPRDDHRSATGALLLHEVIERAWK